MNSWVVVDIEYFGNLYTGLVVKQIAVYGDVLDSIIFKPPSDYSKLSLSKQKNISWLTKFWHGFKWDEGDYDYKFLVNFVNSIKLRYPNRNFYCKGSEKTTFLSGLFGIDFIDLDQSNCPKLIGQWFCSCKKSTSIHSRKNHCAKRKVSFYNAWLESRLNEQSDFATIERSGDFPTRRQTLPCAKRDCGSERTQSAS